MNKFYTCLILCLFSPGVYAQFTPETAIRLPWWNSHALQFNNQPAPVGYNYGCADDLDNSSWVYFNLCDSIKFDLNNSISPNDTFDVVVFGPFTDTVNLASQFVNAPVLNCWDDLTGIFIPQSILNWQGLAKGRYYIMVNRNSAAGNFNIGTHTVPGTWPFNYDYHCSFCNEIISLKKDLCFIDFDSISQRNKLVWEKGDTTDIAGYIIYRENSIASQFDSLDYVPVDSISEYIDHTANPYNKAWRYRLISVSVCGDNPYSNLQNLYYPAIYTTLFLQQGMSSLNSISLNWYSGPNLIPSPGYGPWIQSYFIYHGTTPGNMQLIDSVSSLNYTYTHTSPVPGPNYYQIEMRSTGSCTSSMLPTYSKSGSNIMGTLFTGLSDISPALAFVIQPNPAKGKFSVILSGASHSLKNMLSIHTMNGQLVKTIQVENSQPDVSVSELAPGVYMIVLENEKGINRQKLVVH